MTLIGIKVKMMDAFVGFSVVFGNREQLQGHLTILGLFYLVISLVVLPRKPISCKG